MSFYLADLYSKIHDTKNFALFCEDLLCEVAVLLQRLYLLFHLISLESYICKKYAFPLQSKAALESGRLIHFCHHVSNSCYFTESLLDRIPFWKF
jgi:hypothetical protein